MKGKAMMTEDEMKLWQEMADMTLARCRKRCHSLGSCCEPDYCNLAKDFAKRQGVELKAVGGEVPFLGEDGKCVVPPHLRPLCSLHQCDICGMGFAMDDPEWTSRYFELRERLEETVMT